MRGRFSFEDAGCESMCRNGMRAARARVRFTGGAKEMLQADLSVSAFICKTCGRCADGIAAWRIALCSM